MPDNEYDIPDDADAASAAYARFFAAQHAHEPKPRPQIPGQYFALRPEGLTVATPYKGDGVRAFDEEQLRQHYPQIAEQAIAFRDTHGFPNVTIDQVQPEIVRLRSSGMCVSDAGHKSELLHGCSLGREPKDYSNQLILLPPTRYEPVVAHDEQRRPLSTQELLERERGREVPTKWKWWYLRSKNEWFVAPDVEEGPREPPAGEPKGEASL